MGPIWKLKTNKKIAVMKMFYKKMFSMLYEGQGMVYRTSCINIYISPENVDFPSKATKYSRSH